MEYFALVQTVAPATEPLTLTEAKDWLHVDLADTSQDGVINGLISAARQRCESVTRRALITQTWRMSLDRFPGLVAVSPDYPGWEYLRLGSDGDPRVIRCPKPPLASVTSIKYVDTTGTLQTLDPATYQVAKDGLIGRIFPAYGLYWPIIRPQAEAVQILFVAGAAAAPEEIKDRMKAYVGHCFTRREEQDDDYLERLFWSFQVPGYF
jgi:hypothetical protein